MTIEASSKRKQLAALAVKRKRSSWAGYKNLCDFHRGAYECDFVSPYTKSAGNVSSKIFVMLQDWASEDGLRNSPQLETLKLGYTPDVKTNINLEHQLQSHFGMSISQIYATNLFPFVKPGGMSSGIHHKAMLRAAHEFAIPQIRIVAPRLVIALGMKCFNVLREAIGEDSIRPLKAAIENPIDHSDSGSRIWCQAHTGWDACHRGSAAIVTADWRRMATWFSRHV